MNKRASEVVEASGHLIDSGILNAIFDTVIRHGASFEVLKFSIGRTNNEPSLLTMRLNAESRAVIRDLVEDLVPLGCQIAKPLDALMALHALRAGKQLETFAHHMRKRIAALEHAVDPIQSAYGVRTADTPARMQQRAKRGELMLGQLVLGNLAEQAFEAIYRSKLGASEFRLDDYRESRNDTDYRVLNGGGRPLFRINSKFHGSRFRQAQEQVGLDPADCFPLATYKIWNATEKEKAEHLPYLFLVISTPITAESVVQDIPEQVRELVRLVHVSEIAKGKRDLEE